MTEITDLVDLSGWPDGTRMIARREDPHPGAQLTFTDVDGHRFQVFVTDLADADIAYLEAALPRSGPRRTAHLRRKDTGLANLPSCVVRHQPGVAATRAHRQDLLAWTRLLTLDGELARAEPKRLRYCLLHTAAQIVRTGRQRMLRVSDDWPWADELVAAFDRVHNLTLRV